MGFGDLRVMAVARALREIALIATGVTDINVHALTPGQLRRLHPSVLRQKFNWLVLPVCGLARSGFGEVVG